jgi:hypothetical protein
MKSKILSLILILSLLSPTAWAGVDLNGDADYLSCTKYAGSSGGFTFSAWVNPTSTSGAYMLASQYDNTEGGAYFQFFINGGNVHARIHQTRDTAMVGRKDTGGVLSGWNHYAFTWSGGTTNASIKIYVNGVQTDDSDDGAGSFSGAYTGTLTFRIGTQVFNTPNSLLDGSITDVSIWSDDLSATEISQIASSRLKIVPLQIYTSALLRYWPLDNGSDGTAISTSSGFYKDLSANAVNCTGVDADSDSLNEAERVLSYA